MIRRRKSPSPNRTRAALITSLLLTFAPISGAPQARAAVSQNGTATNAVIGDGSAASCTHSAVAAGIATGGVVTFDCGPDPLTIPITAPLTLVSNSILDGGGRITLDGSADPLNPIQRVLRVPGSVSTTVENLAIMGGRNGIAASGKLTLRNAEVINATEAGILASDFSSAGITEITLHNVSLRDNGANTTTARGGIAAQFRSTFRIYNSEIANNTGQSGGGVVASASSRLLLSDSRVHGNTALAGGGAGGVFATGLTEIYNSAIYSNTGTRAGGVRFTGSNGSAISNTTVAHNHGDITGGLAIGNGGTDVSFGITHVTLFSNTVTSAQPNSGVALDVDPGGAITTTVFLSNTAVIGSADPLSPTLCAGRIQSSGGNYVSDASCAASANDVIGAAPLLSPLSVTGAEPPYLLPAFNSPLIDRARESECAPRDQRGVARPLGLGCDIGAVEFQPGPPMLQARVRVEPVEAAVARNGIVTYTVLVTNTGVGPAVGLTVTLALTGSPTLRAFAPSPASGDSSSVIWIGPGIAPGEALSFTVVMLAPAPLTAQASLDTNGALLRIPATRIRLSSFDLWLPVTVRSP